MAGCCVEPRPKAIVSFYGYGNIIADWLSRPDPFYSAQPVVTRADSGIDLGGPVIAATYDGRGKDQLYLYCRQNGIWPIAVSGVDPHESPGFFTPFCPEKSLGDDYPPTILLHGGKDTDVPYQQSVDMAEALSRKAVTHELVTMRDHGHGFDSSLDDPEVESAYDKVLEFIEKHL